MSFWTVSRIQDTATYIVLPLFLRDMGNVRQNIRRDLKFSLNILDGVWWNICQAGRTAYGKILSWKQSWITFYKFLGYVLWRTKKLIAAFLITATSFVNTAVKTMEKFSSKKQEGIKTEKNIKENKKAGK